MTFREDLAGNAVFEHDLVRPMGTPFVFGGGFDDNRIVVGVRNSSLAVDGRPVHVFYPVVGMPAGVAMFFPYCILVGPEFDFSGLERVGEATNIQIGLDANDMVVQETRHVVVDPCSEPGNFGIVVAVWNAESTLEVSAHFNLDFHNAVGHQTEGRYVIVISQDTDDTDFKGGAWNSSDPAGRFGKFMSPHGFSVGLFKDA
mmetsp:Transcript_21540/g.47017  ORF Transcript_21540/g.47017 Transcript_21540/m.47017 type:complete len:201 (-) Transcript_21540:753-1355(-)